MARATVIHSEDAVNIVFEGNKAKPEPGTGIITFPGGNVEISRCSDGSYYAHISIEDPSTVVASRIDYDYEGQKTEGIIDVPKANHIQHIAMRINQRKDPNP